MKSARIFLLLALFGSFATTPLFAADEDVPRSVSIESGYFPKLYSRRAIWTFVGEIDDVASWAFDSLDRHTPIGDFLLARSAWLIVGSYGWYGLQGPAFVSNHEFGHGAAFSATGDTPTYRWRNSSRSHSNIFSFFFSGLGWNRNVGAQTFGVANNALPPNWTVTMSAGGMNNSMMYAEFVEDEAYYQKGHILDYSSYFRAKRDQYMYAENTENGFTGDLSYLRGYYNGLGYNVSTRDFKTGSLVSLFGSATNWAFYASAIRYALTGNPTLVKTKMGRIRLPDISHYALRNGLSYKIRSGLEYGAYFIPVAIEYVYKGKASGEVTAGYVKALPSSQKRASYLSLLGVINSQAAIGVRAQYDYPLKSALGFSFGGSVYQAKTFDAERYLVRLLSTSLGFEAWARVSLNY